MSGPEKTDVPRLGVISVATEHARRHRLALLVGGLTLVGLVVAVRARPPVLVDDAGITARYAERIAEGKGWTYNDGDQTNGASAPLYTVLLATAHLVGMDVLTAARMIGTACFAATVGMVTHLGGRFVGIVGGALAGFLLVVSTSYQDRALNGMESALAAALGLAVLIALSEDRDGWAGLLLGLALLNKLDAGLLAAAVALAYLLVRHRPPWRIAAISAALLAPWLIFSVVYFGSPVPYSFTQKASGGVANPGVATDVTWVLDGLVSTYRLQLLLAVASVAVIPVLARRSRPRATALLGALGWCAFHAAAFSLLDLGDRYTWYLTVLYPPIALGAGTALGFAVTEMRRRPAFALLLTGAVTLQAVGLPQLPDGDLGLTARRVGGERAVSEYEGLEQQRVAAGQYLGEVAAPGDVILTCFGWTEYFAPQANIDETCPLNTRDEVGPPTWGVAINYPGSSETDPPAEGMTLAASFISEIGDGTRVDVYRTAP